MTLWPPNDLGEIAQLFEAVVLLLGLLLARRTIGTVVLSNRHTQTLQTIHMDSPQFHIRQGPYSDKEFRDE